MNYVHVCDCLLSPGIPSEALSSLEAQDACDTEGGGEAYRRLPYRHLLPHGLLLQVSSSLARLVHALRRIGF